VTAVAEERRIAPSAAISLMNVYARKVWEELMGEAARPERKKVRVVEFVDSRCPHCHKSVLNPKSLYRRALRFCSQFVDIERITHYVDSREGLMAAREVGVNEVPRVFVNGREIPTKYITSEDPRHFEILVRYLCDIGGAGLAAVEWERKLIEDWQETPYESGFF